MFMFSFYALCLRNTNAVKEAMKRLAALMILSALSSACFADEPAFCKSMCRSEKTQCLSAARSRVEKEGLLPTNTPEKNPFARTAQVQMRSSDGGSLEKSGNDQRRLASASACDDSYQRCTRGCSVEGDKDAVGAVVSRHAKKPG